MESTGLIKAAGYVRVSSAKQLDERSASIEQQIDFINSWAERDGAEIVEIYIDPGISAKNMEDRPDIQKLRIDAEKKTWTRLYCYHNDRLNRDKADASYLFKELSERLGVDLKFGNLGNLDLSTPEGGLMYGIMSDVAEYQRKDLGRKTKGGMAKRKEQGVHIGRLSSFFEKIDPYGSMISENVQVKTEFQVLVADILKARNAGLSYRKIAAKVGWNPANDVKKVKRIIETMEWLNVTNSRCSSQGKSNESKVKNV